MLKKNFHEKGGLQIGTLISKVLYYPSYENGIIGFKKYEATSGNYVSLNLQLGSEGFSSGKLHRRETHSLFGTIDFSKFVLSSEEELLENGYIESISLLEFYKKTNLDERYFELSEHEIPQAFRDVFFVTSKGSNDVKLKSHSSLGQRIIDWDGVSINMKNLAPNPT